MEKESVYGEFLPVLEKIRISFEQKITEYQKIEYAKNGKKLFEHLSSRIKSEESIIEKCKRKNLPVTPESALHTLHDSIGIRIVCSFIDDVYANAEKICSFENCKVIQKKDYIKHAKNNGYRSFHMILEYTAPFEDTQGNNPGIFYIEIQIRTIAMDSWASLEHQLKYKKDIKNQEIIVAELKRCADELASCDLSMSTIREMIENS